MVAFGNYSKMPWQGRLSTPSLVDGRPESTNMNSDLKLVMKLAAIYNK
jgi:hypothetical protein